ncbi:isoleucine--tRNA ligase [Pseudoalteromonas luteoviolacea]|uniref:isoleucine--tRNA ligase n=1 Tax=Pseudoalteromonas luteoviolacea TaxID=43657 RepID=UPI001B361349|nr:isoleucine--tRNA ligase [Pseudoalteromonas luteoviolacea]MBQ4839769.1 isoleucine--tRNA ligase [Pseudoalteromonas luteoviolacea]
MNGNTLDTDQNTFSFVDAERKVLDFWEKQDIFQKSLRQTANNPPYAFYDGPPFATGKPHHGHLLASTIKDIIPRYFTMKGYYVQRRFGWDCHGLPIEHETDKTLGMSAKEAVETLGIKAYNDECRGIVQRYTKEWRSTVTRIGRWVDFDNDYRTMEPWYMESVWWVFKQLWEKDLITQGVKVVPFSTTLGTVLSNFEAGSNYKDVQDPALEVLFKLEDEDCYIAAWTTTPWTLPSNLGLCVKADADYIKVLDEDKDIHFIIAKARLEAIGKGKNLTVVQEYTGAELVGKRYEPLFDYFKELKNEGAFVVLADDYVTMDSGTGIVHIAPAFGEDDNRVMKEANIQAVVCPLNMVGEFTEEVTDFSGMHVKEADKKIIRHLKETGHLYSHTTIVHSYPFCPRSDTPIIYRSIPSWYVKVEQMRDKLVALNQQINWVPEYIKEGRMGNWLAGAIDWAVSRNRYWGTPIPLWRNDVTGNYLCIGSIEELERYSGIRVDDLHRDYVDDISFSVAGEEGTYQRIEEVLDCWFESGAMPYAQLHYPFENQSLFESSFPAEFIAEGLDQTRGWFYTLLVLSQALHDKPAFKNVIVNGIVMAEDGKKMSKRLRNYTQPDDIMEEFGADALRLYLINSGLVKGEPQHFSNEGVKLTVRRALLPWWNAFKFLKTYIEIDGWKPSNTAHTITNPLDHWILSKLQTLKLKVTTEIENYQLYNVIPVLFEFIEQLTNWYIRLNRSRFWAETLTEDKACAYQTLYTCIYELSLAMAPFAPFLSEHIYQEMLALQDHGEQPESVHLCAYPTVDEALIQPELEDALALLQNVVLLGRQKRNKERIKTKIPLMSLTVIHRDTGLLQEIKKLESYLQTELNVKSVVYREDEDSFINFYAKPNSPLLGKKLGKSFKQYKTLIEALTGEQLRQLEKDGSIELEGMRFDKEEILTFREPKEGSEVISDSYISIELDCKLNEELLAEGLAREIVNRVQKTRKQLDFKIEDRIHVEYACDQALDAAITAHTDTISSETLALSFEKRDIASDDTVARYDVEGHTLLLRLSKAT